jgi:hypothetical protein
MFTPTPVAGLRLSPVMATSPVLATPPVVVTSPDAVTSSVGTSGADAMDVPAATATFDVTGAGIRVGILSDSFDAQGTTVLQQEESDGDLPSTIDILSDYSSGTDEGRAMAEVVHAVAPGAAIDFATAYNTDQQFAAGILSLAAAGCNIIVDDITYLDEPFFEDSNVIQQAAQTVIAEGVSYFTAASNEGVNYYQAPVDLVEGTLPNGRHMMLEDFGPTAAEYSGSDVLQDVDLSTGITLDFDLQWTQPFLTDGSTTDIGPGSAYTLALYLFSGTKVVATATTDVTGGDPDQVMQYDPTVAGTYELAIALTNGTVPAGDTLKYVVYQSYTTAGTQMTIEDGNAGQGGGGIIGHELVAGANTVGAVNAADPTTPEDFSSFGPGTLDTYSATGAVTSTTVESKPDFVAPDGITTSVSGFSTFYGTSAAAPDAAAVAALMLQANPNLTPAQVTSALESTTTLVTGSVDQVGSGLVDADAAVQAVNGDVWTPAAGGNWDTAANWSAAAAPTAADPATLSNYFGTLTAAYTVHISSTDAVADTLTVGNATSASVMPDIQLAIAAGGLLNIVTGATVTQNGTLNVAGTLTTASLDVEGGTSTHGGASLTVAGALTDSGALTGSSSGQVTVTGGGTLSIGAGMSGASITLDTDATLLLNATIGLTSNLTGLIALAGGSAEIDLAGLPYQVSESMVTSGSTLLVTSLGTTLAQLDVVNDTGQDLSPPSNDGDGGTEITVACYCRGTRIATPSGEVPVEALRSADLVLTARGMARPVRWIGRRDYPAEVVERERCVQPVRIRAGALGPLLPRRDLDVSPQHALLLRDEGREVLVSACLLVNGVSILRLPTGGEVAYFHIELREHDVVLAEGQAAETFVDRDSRAAFANAGEYARIYPDATAQVVPFCAPRIDGGEALARIRAAIDIGSGVRPGRLVGSVDRVAADWVEGWAHDLDTPAGPVLLEILVDDEITGVLLADQFRADLWAMNGGHCAFFFVMPPGWEIGTESRLTVRRASDRLDVPRTATSLATDRVARGVRGNPADKARIRRFVPARAEPAASNAQ